MSRKLKKENEQANEKGFFIRFSIYAVVFFVVAVLLPDSVYAPLNRLTANLTSLLLDVFGMPVIARGEYLFAGGLSVRVVFPILFRFRLRIEFKVCLPVFLSSWQPIFSVWA